jgi:hypothetical protein
VKCAKRASFLVSALVLLANRPAGADAPLNLWGSNCTELFALGLAPWEVLGTTILFRDAARGERPSAAAFVGTGFFGGLSLVGGVLLLSGSARSGCRLATGAVLTVLGAASVVGIVWGARQPEVPPGAARKRWGIRLPALRF